MILTILTYVARFVNEKNRALPRNPGYNPVKKGECSLWR